MMHTWTQTVQHCTLCFDSYKCGFILQSSSCSSNVGRSQCVCYPVCTLQVPLDLWNPHENCDVAASVWTPFNISITIILTSMHSMLWISIFIQPRTVDCNWHQTKHWQDKSFGDEQWWLQQTNKKNESQQKSKRGTQVSQGWQWQL